MTAHAPRSAPDGDDWPEILPFDGEARPPLKTTWLPDVMGLMADAVAMSTQVPVDVAALAALGVASAAVAGKVVVGLRSDRYEQANLWTASVLPSGERKSAALRPIVAPLLEFEGEAARARAVDAERDRAAYETLLAELAEARTQAAKGAREERAEAARRRDELAARKAHWVHVEDLQLLIDDATPEAAIEVLAQQGGRIALISDEAHSFFAHALGRYAKGKGANIDTQLKSYSGALIVVNRKGGRGRIRVPRPSLTIAVTMQPRVLREAGDHPELVERGLLPRFLFGVPHSMVGSRNADPPPMPADVAAAWRGVVHLLCGTPERRDDQGQLLADELTVSSDGLALLRDLREEVEGLLCDGGVLAHIAEWGNRVEGSAARIALVLHLTELAACAVASSQRLAPPFVPIDAIWVRKAIEMARAYWLPHALAAFALLHAKPVVRDAQRLRDWLVRRGSLSFTQRDAHRGCQSWLGGATDLEELLEELTRRGFVRPVAPEVERHVGRPASPTWEVNPRALKPGVGVTGDER